MCRSIEQSPEARRYQALVESIQDYAILMLDSDGYVISSNQGAQLITGYAPAEIIGSHFSRFYPAEALARDLPAHELRMAKAIGRFEDEGWRLRKDGSLFWANVVISRMVDERGELIGFSKITRDLSARRQQELALRQSEERFRLLVTGVRDYAIFMPARSASRAIMSRRSSGATSRSSIRKKRKIGDCLRWNCAVRRCKDALRMKAGAFARTAHDSGRT
jgi:PAS domain S-box-containing protein